MLYICRLALELAKEVGVSLPTSSAANGVYEEVLQERGDEDISAVFTAYKKQKK